MTVVDFARIAEQALGSAEQLVSQWLPGGSKEGKEYVALNPTRQDAHKGSFKINLDTGKWSDFACDEKGGDLISLYAYLKGIDQASAADHLASALSTHNKYPGKPKQARNPKWHPITPVPENAGQRPLHPKLGRPGAVWTYRNEVGEPLGHVCRFDTQNGKQVLPLTYCQDAQRNRSWRWQSWTKPRPLYGLDRLASKPESVVLVVEGEKTADAAQSIFPNMAVITSPGGSNAAKKADWTQLKGREVVIWPDADLSGRKYAQDVAIIAKQMGAVQVSIVPLPPELPSSWDLADELPKGWGQDTLTQLIQGCLNRSTIAPEEPRPLQRKAPEAAPFPTAAMATLGPVAKAIADKVQCPEAIAAQSVLAAAALAVQGHADVVLPHGQTRPLSLYMMTIAATGERKSAADSLALQPIELREKTLKRQYEKEKLSYDNKKQAWDQQRQHIHKSGKRSIDVETVEQALNALGAPPPLPLEPMLTCPEPTFEGLTRLLMNGQPSVGIFSNEGGQFIGGHGMNQDNRLKTATGLSSLWDGSPVRRVRAKDGAIIMHGRRVCLHLLAQPKVSAELLNDDVLVDQGFLSRILVAYPQSTAGGRLYQCPSPDIDQHIQDYSTRMGEILETPLPVEEGSQNELSPCKLPLGTQAIKMWIDFHNEVETQIADGLKYAPVRGLANKAPEHAARIAAVLALYDDLEAKEISTQHMESGIVLTQHYLGESLRLGEAGAGDSTLEWAECLLKWLHGKWGKGVVSLPDIYMLGPNAIRSRDKAKQVADILVEHGWLEPIEGGTTVNGKFRREVYRLFSPQ